jgi:N-methylhydantoinase B
VKKSKRHSPDPASRSLFASLFSSIAEEMGMTLARTAYSPNIKERRDFSCALFDAGGKLVAQAAHIPVHLGAMPMSVAAAMQKFSSWSPGDVVILNDPFAGGTHLPDITLVSPVFRQDVKKGTPVAWLATRAHHADVGGMSPGSIPISREIYQEGIRIPPVRLYETGELNTPVMDLLLANVRTPEERLGDLRAQVSAHIVGEKRLHESMNKHGVRQLHLQMQDLLDYGRQMMESTIRRIPDGRYTFEDHLDDDGCGGPSLPIRVSVEIRGSRVVLDFTGTADQLDCNLNAVESITRSAVYYCFICLMVTGDDPASQAVLRDPLVNAGCFEPVEVNAPVGTIVNAIPPVGVVGGNIETSQRIVDAVLGALSKALPGVIPAASQGTMNNVALGGTDTRTGLPFAYYETTAGGMGARPGLDGIDGVQVHLTNTMNTPVEALEYVYPLRVERYALAPGTGGKGKYRGGNGVYRDLRMLCDLRGSLLTERRKIPPYGLQGGGEGKPGENRLVRNGKMLKLPGKTQFELLEGDVLKIRTPGGGGWGIKNKK